MTNSRNLSAIDLTGADCFLRAIDGEVRRTAGAGHLAQIVLRMGTGFSTEAFTSLLRDVAAANPIMRAPIRRRGLLGPPRYVVSRAISAHNIAVDIHDGGQRSETLPAQAFVRRLNSTIATRTGPLIAADVATYADGRADVALTWLHLLFDGAGSERFVEHLAHCSADNGWDRSLAICSSKPSASRSLRRRADQASAWHRTLVGDATKSIRSPAGPLDRTAQKLDYRWTRLERDQTDTIKTRSHEFAGILTPTLFYLAAAIRGHQAVARNRGQMPDKWLVPLPVNLRPKGTQGETFRTHVSLIWFQATASQADDFEGLVDTLKRQRLAAIKDGLIEAGVAAMDFVRMIPGRLFTKLARRDYRGELCSFFFAFTDEFAPAAEQLCGAQIETGSHVPSVPPSPGSSVVMSLRDGRLTLTQIRQRGALSDEEDEILREHILADLLGP
jgi:hypothetical protein